MNTKDALIATKTALEITKSNQIEITKFHGYRSKKNKYNFRPADKYCT